MAITALRIDDRLIHGQVTTAWLRLFPSDVILIANDCIASDPTYATIFTVATVPGTRIRLLGVAEAAAYLLGEGVGHKVFVVVPSPEDALGLIEAGVVIRKINIGGMQARSGARSLAKAVFAQPAEEAAFRALARRGVEMEVRMLPSDRVGRLNLQ